MGHLCPSRGGKIRGRQVTVHGNIQTGVDNMRMDQIVRRVATLGVAASLGIAGLLLGGGPRAAFAQEDVWKVRDHYDKLEAQIPMRDGVKLFVAIYTPKDKSKNYPILLNRTPYGVGPYGPNQYSFGLGPSQHMVREGYIFVHQDVRGRWMSEGKYDNMRPHVMGKLPIDESSDTYDTIEWLLENVPGNNGKVGMWGISYPGFYAAAALPEHHPALVAASPQAPISDFFFDDFHHNGAYLLSYFIATSTFGYQHSGPTDKQWYSDIKPETRDGYQFYMSLGALSNAKKYFGPDNFFWNELSSHPNYDEFWQARSLLPHLASPIKTNVLTVGGLFDAEDLYGPLHIYQQIEKNNPGTHNTLVMGPWSHGAWAGGPGVNRVGNIVFGSGINNWYQREVEAPFFRHFLKGEGAKPQYEAMIFDTGKLAWNQFEQWPPSLAVPGRIYLHGNGGIGPQPQSEAEPAFREFVSDPANPVTEQRREDVRVQFTPREYMTSDQRFASERPDVLVFQSEVLEQDWTMVGDITANLFVSTDHTDCDWIVKVIDVFPADTPNDPATPQGVKLGGYQMMVRGDVMRGRFRNDFARPEPFVPHEITPVRVPLQDICHTFKKGHRVMIHVQSTWFPLIDRCPQNYVANIFEAQDEDFAAAQHRVFLSGEHASYLEIRTLK